MSADAPLTAAPPPSPVQPLPPARHHQRRQPTARLVPARQRVASDDRHAAPTAVPWRPAGVGSLSGPQLLDEAAVETPDSRSVWLVSWHWSGRASED